MEDDAPLFTGELHTQDENVAYAGSAEGAPQGPFDREIDCGGDLLLPGFKNAHTHSAGLFLRSFADDLPLKEWLYERMLPNEAHLTPDAAYALTRLAILEYLTSGVTCMADMYYYRPAVAQACADSGFRALVMDGVNDFGGSPERTLQERAEVAACGPLVRHAVSVHAEYTTSLPLLTRMAALLGELAEPCYIHMNETREEVDGCVMRHGVRPFELMDGVGLFDHGGVAYHCVHVSDNELAVMQRRGVIAVTCPASNCKLGSGVAPVQTLLARGIPVGIGTDSAASNNALDMFREMYLVTALQKLQHGADAMDALSVLRMACCVGAAACGFPECGCLAAGRPADIVRIDLAQPNMHPLHNIPKNVVFAGSKQNVRMTMVAGRILYEDGRFHIGDDPARIYAQADAFVRSFS